MLSLHKSIVTSIRYSAGLSSGPGPIRNCISSPWGIFFQDSRKVWLMMDVSEQNDENLSGKKIKMMNSKYKPHFSTLYKNIETKKNTCCTCLTPLQTGHPSLLACHPNSYLDVHEEISKSVSQRSKVVFISLTYLNTGPDVRPPISS